MKCRDCRYSRRIGVFSWEIKGCVPCNRNQRWKRGGCKRGEPKRWWQRAIEYIRFHHYDKKKGAEG